VIRFVPNPAAANGHTHPGFHQEKMQMNRITLPSGRQPDRSRPLNPRDGQDGHAAELYQALLRARHLGRTARASDLLRAIYRMGYRVEQLADVGLRLVPAGERRPS
jgi:hypothetical protein